MPGVNPVDKIAKRLKEELEDLRPNAVLELFVRKDESKAKPGKVVYTADIEIRYNSRVVSDYE